MENNSYLPPSLTKPKLTKKYEPSPYDYQILALIEREQLTVMDVLDAMLPNPTSYLYLRVDLLDKAGLLTRYRAHSNAEQFLLPPKGRIPRKPWHRRNIAITSACVQLALKQYPSVVLRESDI